MNWEQYSAMTRAHKEEYDYRFKREQLRWPISLDSCVTYFTVVMALLATAIAMQYTPSIENNAKLAQGLLVTVIELAGAFFFFILIEICVWIARESVHHYKRITWLKARGYT